MALATNTISESEKVVRESKQTPTRPANGNGEKR